MEGASSLSGIMTDSQAVYKERDCAESPYHPRRIRADPRFSRNRTCDPGDQDLLSDEYRVRAQPDAGDGPALCADRHRDQR